MLKSYQLLLKLNLRSKRSKQLPNFNNSFLFQDKLLQRRCDHVSFWLRSYCQIRRYLHSRQRRKTKRLLGNFPSFDQIYIKQSITFSLHSHFHMERFNWIHKNNLEPFSFLSSNFKHQQWSPLHLGSHRCHNKRLLSIQQIQDELENE